jgi:hypothetical protein
LGSSRSVHVGASKGADDIVIAELGKIAVVYADGNGGLRWFETDEIADLGSPIVERLGLGDRHREDQRFRPLAS